MKMEMLTAKNQDDINSIRSDSREALHEKRFSEQDSGRSAYLGFYDSGKIIGHVYVDYNLDNDNSTIPIIQDLRVSNDERNKGIGKKIMAETETFLKEKGFKKIALEVEAKKDWLIEFYKKQGYEKEGGVINHKWADDDTKEQYSVDVLYLVKDLV